MTVTIRRWRGMLPLLAVAAMAQTGCITRWLGMGGEPEVEGAKGSFPIARLERLMDSFADRDVAMIADACEALKRDAPSAAERRAAQHLKLANGNAVYDIVTQPQPLGRLADLYVLVELQHLVWVEEGGAQRQFGDRAQLRLVPAVEEAHRGMSRIAELAMKPDRRRKLDDLLRRWRERNPNVQFITGIRFGSLPEVGGKSILESASSFFDVINPLSDTSESVERSRLLAERAFFYSKRFPRLLDWQAEAALEDTMAKPEVREILDNVGRVSRTLEELPNLLSREREEIVRTWDDRQDEVRGSVREIHSTIVDARELAVRATETGTAFEKAFRELHEVTGSHGSVSEPSSSPPFDIRDYTVAAGKFEDLAREGTTLIANAESLIDHVVWRAVEIAALMFVLVLGYRVIVTRWVRPRAASSRNSDIRRPPTTIGPRAGWPT